jgi:hypothetical protein
VLGAVMTLGIATQLDPTALVTGVVALAALSLYALVWSRHPSPADRAGDV